MNGKNLFFSVVVPLYNKDYSIQRCIDSVLNQSYTNFEIIVVNDGSIDNSVQILKSTYKEQIESKKILLIEQKNQGVSVARNVGISNSKFNYICFLDADDEWKRDFLFKISRLISDFPEASMYCLAHEISKNNSIPIKKKQAFEENFRGYIEDFFLSSSIGDVANSSKVCVKKEALLETGGFPIGITTGEDLYVWILIALKNRVAYEVSYEVIVHQQTDNSRISRKNSVPYPFIYFSQNKNIELTKSLKKYLFLIFYKHFLSSLLKFRFKEAYLILYFYAKIFI